VHYIPLSDSDNDLVAWLWRSQQVTLISTLCVNSDGNNIHGLYLKEPAEGVRYSFALSPSDPGLRILGLTLVVRTEQLPISIPKP
jgi:hypothetical protein